MSNKELLTRIRTLIDRHMEGCGEGVLTTVSRDKQPHATWMGTICCPTIERLVTITSPDSRKVRYILENPNVEWLFSNREKTELVYMRGRARVLEDVERVEKAWQQMPDKSRAYFLAHQKIGITFFIIETEVDTIEYRLPEEDQSWFFSPHDFPASPAKK